jgi:hypothetical protein
MYTHYSYAGSAPDCNDEDQNKGTWLHLDRDEVPWKLLLRLEVSLIMLH